MKEMNDMTNSRNNGIQNNKELIPLEHYLRRFAREDPEQMAVRTHTAYDDGDQTFSLRFLGRDYRISWPSFRIAAKDREGGFPDLTESNQARILMIRYLLEGAALPPGGKYLSFREVPWGEVYDRQFSGRCVQRLARSWGSRTEEYGRAMRLLGAYRVESSDAGYEVEIFPDFTIRFLLWEGDEEFPPSAQILFSDNCAAAFHAEDLVVICEMLLNMIRFSGQRP